MYVSDLENKDLIFISDSQDVSELRRQTGTDYDSYFIRVGDGEYTQIYGMYGIVPYLEKRVYEVAPQ